MSVIAPAVTVETPEAYKATVERLQGFATRVHVDISDGEFAPSFLLGENNLYWPENWQVDVHAMVARPSEHLDRLVALKPSMIIFHAEITEDRSDLVAKIKQAGIRVGVALLKTTVPSTIADVLKMVDHVMIFSGELGQYGGKASLMQIEKIRLVKAINPNVEIGWDGGVNLENAYTLTQGGVDVLNAGGAIANSDNPAGMYEALTKEINKRGII
jgi:ribulose-phosphate 3-epimerase